MKFLIVGLGNVGAEYNHTRHNIGFDVVDALATELGATWQLDRHAYVAEAKLKGKSIWLLKPTTYMNLSGQALRYWVQKEKFDLANIMVILDDLNLDLGRMRIRIKGSAGGHNGLKNIEEVMQTNEYPRMRLGIGSNFRQGQQVDFVLGKWATSERELVQAVVQEAGEAVKSFAFIGLERTMNIYNSKQITVKE